MLTSSLLVPTSSLILQTWGQDGRGSIDCLALYWTSNVVCIGELYRLMVRYVLLQLPPRAVAYSVECERHVWEIGSLVPSRVKLITYEIDTCRY